jgi:ubiquinone/menaquinone biosynthesis C-methylase UbiE
LEFIRNYVRPGERILDYGCGNGRLLELIIDVPGIEYYGIDVSERLIDMARSRYPGSNIHFSTIPASCSGEHRIASADRFFNTAYSIAVFHHFPSRGYRENMARELYRVTAEGGRVVVTVWNVWQKRYRKNILKNWFLKLRGKSELDWNDCLVSFTDNQGNVFQRFHHAFTKRELKKLFEGAGFEIERCEVVGGRNIVLVGEKGKML